MPLPASKSVTNVGTESTPSTQRSIFRAEALQHFVQNQEKVVLPNLVSPRAFLFLWILATVVMLVGLLLAFWPWLGVLTGRVA